MPSKSGSYCSCTVAPLVRAALRQSKRLNEEHYHHHGGCLVAWGALGRSLLEHGLQCIECIEGCPLIQVVQFVPLFSPLPGDPPPKAGSVVGNVLYALAGLMHSKVAILASRTMIGELDTHGGGTCPSMDWFSRDIFNRNAPYWMGKSLVSGQDFPQTNPCLGVL